MPKKSFTTVQIIFLASIIALDFSIGVVFKSVLSPTGILNVIRVDMLVPVALMMLTRLTIDRFGTLLLYETTWGALSVLAMPAAFGLPGILKLVPAVFQGALYDALFSSLRQLKWARVYLAAVLGGALATGVRMLLKVQMGLPWSQATKIYFGIEFITAALLNALAAYVAIALWKRIHTTHWVRRLQVDDRD
jgi:hypothetical protein